MNKKIKLLTSALLLSGSLLSVVPAYAATTTETSTTKINSTVSKPSGNITVKAISTNQPSDGYEGILWCTGNGVYIRNKDGSRVSDGNGGYYTMNRGDRNRFYFDEDNGGFYYATGTGNAYVSKQYLSIVRVSR